MSIALTDVKTELERRMFPKILTLDDYQGITDAVLRELTRYAPIHKFVSLHDCQLCAPEDPLRFHGHSRYT